MAFKRYQILPDKLLKFFLKAFSTEIHKKLPKAPQRNLQTECYGHRNKKIGKVFPKILSLKIPTAIPF